MTPVTLPRLITLASAITLGAALIPAAAGAAPAMRTDVIARVLATIADANGDGKIDTSEMATLRDRRFADLDANQDGVVTAAEVDRLEQRAERRAKLLKDAMDARFAELDADADGSVSRAEYMNAPAGALWSLADVDGDGAISTDEMTRIATALAAR